MADLREETAVAHRIIVDQAATIDVHPDLIYGRDRRPDVIKARCRAVAEIRRVTDLSYPELGRLLGGRHHTTVMAMVDTADRPAKQRAAGLPCTVEGCDRPRRGRGWCGGHYDRWRKHGSPLPDIPLGQHGTLRPRGCGTEASYQRGCRCGGCRTAHADRVRNSYRRRTVPADRVFGHVAALVADGMSQTEVARRAGVAQATVSALLRGRTVGMWPETAARLLDVTDAGAELTVVPDRSCEGCDAPAAHGGRFCGVGRCEQAAASRRWSWSRTEVA